MCRAHARHGQDGTVPRPQGGKCVLRGRIALWAGRPFERLGDRPEPIRCHSVVVIVTPGSGSGGCLGSDAGASLGAVPIEPPCPGMRGPPRERAAPRRRSQDSEETSLTGTGDSMIPTAGPGPQDQGRSRPPAHW